MTKDLKLKLKRFLSLIPIADDLLLHRSQSVANFGFRGIYSSYAEASRAISTKKQADYDKINGEKKSQIELERERLEEWFHDIDYPLLYWLSRLMTEQTTLLEFGGSVGHFFYSSQKYIEYPPGLKWTIYELQQAVELGAILAAERGENRLTFIDSSELKESQPCDIFLSAGALQYLEGALSTLLSQLSTNPPHVLIHNLPVHLERHFWTLQNLGACELPYQIYSEPDLLHEMEKMGYERVASWTNPRELRIPFHQKTQIKGYMGYYFRSHTSCRRGAAVPIVS